MQSIKRKSTEKKLFLLENLGEKNATMYDAFDIH